MPFAVIAAQIIQQPRATLGLHHLDHRLVLHRKHGGENEPRIHTDEHGWSSRSPLQRILLIRVTKVQILAFLTQIGGLRHAYGLG